MGYIFTFLCEIVAFTIIIINDKIKISEIYKFNYFKNYKMIKVIQKI